MLSMKTLPATGQRRLTACLLTCCGLLFGTSLGAAAGEPYQTQIKPLFFEKCGACHSALKQEAGLRVDAGELIHRGGDSGPVIVPGKIEQSLLYEKVATDDPDLRMPPAGAGERLTSEQLAAVAAWIKAGARYPQDEEIPPDPVQHWAYQLPQRPDVPAPPNELWSHPIDALIADQHQRRGLQAVPLADRHTRLRRVYFDLIGLPPTREQLQTFLEDDSPHAWQTVVDSLLENPAYGERWGRHWMDVWRYSDWDGYKQQLRGSQRHIWRWREWIIKSLNADKGYDRMIMEMLAGDELAPADPSVLPATGFLARNYHKSNRNIWLDATVEHTAKAFLGMTLNCARCHDHKFDPLPQTTYYQFRAIFEPHQVRTDRLPGRPNIMQDGLPRAYDADLNVETFLYLQGNEKQPDKDHPLAPAVPDFLGGQFAVQSVELPWQAWQPALLDYIERERLAAAKRQVTQAQRALKSAESELSAESKAVPTPPAANESSESAASTELVATDTSPADTSAAENSATKSLTLARLKAEVADLNLESLQARYAADRAKSVSPENPTDEFVKLAQRAADLERQLKLQQAQLDVRLKTDELQTAKASDEADAAKKKAAIDTAQKALKTAQQQLQAAEKASSEQGSDYTPVGTEYPRHSSGRRLALARWIASSRNPLTARVAVNQIWMWHFGQPLVENVFDFGLRSPKPEHHQLLDWLAVELMEHNWSLKHVHRLIVTSRTWQLQSTSGELSHRSHAADPDNRFLWRMNVRRLDAEIIRDNVLAVSEQLDLSHGGPEIDYREGEKSKRRSIYLQHAYEKQMTMLVQFDAASPNECYRRSESVVPQQALALTNSSMSLAASRLLAKRLWDEVAEAEKPTASFVRAAYLQILSRPPATEELTACAAFLDRQSETLADTTDLTRFIGGTQATVAAAQQPQQRARENLIQVLMNHNDFVTVR